MKATLRRSRPTVATRRAFFRLAGVLFVAAVLFCCISLILALGSRAWQRPEAVWGRRGVGDGRFQRPRAIAIDPDDRIYVVDKTARIQVFDSEGQFIRGWRTPAHETGKPTGLAIGCDGNVLVADTHYFRILIYSPEGELLGAIPDDALDEGPRTPGQGPGEFGQVSDVVQDSKGNYYVAEKGEYDRIQKFSPRGKFLLQWGGHGREPGQFALPQSLAVDENDHIWVADAVNHRIQVFDGRGKLLTLWGSEGSEPGQLYYPYDLILADGRTVYVCEYGNHRIQKFTRDGRSLGCWGTNGREEGQLDCPWGLVRDSRGKIHVLDTNNHRVQRFGM